MTDDPIKAALRLLAFHGDEPLAVEYDNDVGPNDEGFWEWWSVGGVRFTSEEHANAFCDLLKAARAAQEGGR